MNYDAKGKDSYGHWDNGKQITPERINGSTLIYDHKKHEWKSR